MGIVLLDPARYRINVLFPFMRDPRIPSIHTVSYSTHISASNWNPIATKIFSYTISENCYKSIPSRPQYWTLEIKIGWRKVWLSKMV
jgi:hypothetical protein